MVNLNGFEETAKGESSDVTKCLEAGAESHNKEAVVMLLPPFFCSRRPAVLIMHYKHCFPY